MAGLKSRWMDIFKFMGHLLTDKGIWPDPDKVKGISEMPPPTDTEGVFQLCGIIKFFKDFIPSLSSIMEPIYTLKGKNVPFVWSTTQIDAFQKVKDTPWAEPNLQIL